MSDYAPGGGRRMHHAVCASCGNDCQVPFRPTGIKPVYCDACFGKNGNTHAKPGSGPDYTQELEEISRKLDLLIEAVHALGQGGAETAYPETEVETEDVSTSEVDVETEAADENSGNGEKTAKEFVSQS